MTGGTLSSSIPSVCHLWSSYVTSAGNASGTFVGDTLSSFIVGSTPLSAILGYFLSFIAGAGPSSTVLGCFLSFVTNDSP